MARAARLLAPGHPHHLLLRGHNREPVFRDDEDRRRFLDMLEHVCREHRVPVHAYVLLDNHVHLLLTPPTEAALTRMMQALGRRYVAAFNQRHGRSGALWEGRYRASVLEAETALLAVQRHMELHPWRDALAPELHESAWSSLAHHLGARHDPLLTDHPLFWRLGNTPFEREAAWRQFLQEAPSREQVAGLQRQLFTGGVIGRPGFVQQLSQALGRPLIARPRGRPRKAQAGEEGGLAKTVPN